MDAPLELERLLARPSPLLLPWLARRVAVDDLRIVASAAAPHLELSPGAHWPVIADATAAVVARRCGTDDRDLLHRVLRVLPPVAAHLAPQLRRAVSWEAVGPDAARYAAIADEWEIAARTSGAGASARDAVPPLADLGSLALLREVREGQPVTPSPAEAAYLLPYLDPVPQAWAELALAAVDAAVGHGAVVERLEWFTRAVAARVLPLLDEAEVEDVTALLTVLLGAPEVARLRTREPLAAPEEELTVAHGDVSRLTALADRVDPDLLTELCRAAVLAVRDETDPIAVHRNDGASDDLAVGADADGLSDGFEVGFGRSPLDIDSGIDGLTDDRWPPDAYSYGGDLPYAEPEPDEVSGRPVRHVNVRVAPMGGDPVVNRPLPADTDLEVLCSVGAFDPGALTAGAADATFPDEFLPDAALDLTAVLTVGGTVRTAALHVPARGDSATVRLPLAKRPREAVIEAELGLYHEVALIQLVALVLPVEGAAGVPTATVTYRLSSSLADLTPFVERSLSVSVSAPSGRSRFLVNGTRFDPHALLAEPARVDTAVRAVRTALYDAHFRAVDEREVSRFDRQQGKPVAELTADLARLALCGRRVYLEMFGAQTIARGLPAFLRTEGRARQRPPVIQIVDPTMRSVPVPWAAVYDLPLGSVPSAYQPCRSLRDLGSDVRDGQAVPVVCPYDGDHRQDDGRWLPDQLCPWGFWGLSTLLEHPPHVVGRDLTAVVGAGPHRVFLAADGPDLDERGCRTHLDTLRRTLSDELDHVDRPGADALGAALGQDVDVVYLFCHCGRDVSAAGAPPDPYLHFDRKITPTDVNQWIETVWPAEHWQDRHPLVVINGCHTVETLSGSLADFVVAFTSWARGAGVIGTEVTVDQPVAAWAMELFLDALRTRPVGEALRAMRWAMLGRGNVMGLAYTPYCLATLTLREGDGAA